LPSAIDFSVSGIFLQSTGMVQGVLALLVLASVLSWAIIIEKTVSLGVLRRQARAFEAVAKGNVVRLKADRPDGLAAMIFAEGRDEWGVEKAGESITNRRDRAERAMRDAMVSELMRAESRLHYLATIGSAAPFIGLFGTVWGIMHAFAGIAQTNDTSLAVVAPGIAEALSTTAIGLVAAIPATIAYNKLASDFGALGRRLTLDIAALARRLGETTERRAAG
jgi:biopolymer transport protein TolQ